MPKGPRGALFRRLLPRVQDLLVAIEEIAQKRKRTASQVAINWCLCKGTVPIPGVKNMKQATDNLSALQWKLTAQEIADLDFLAENTQGKMVQNIFQTR